MPLLHHINQALRAHTLFQLDVDYMVKDGGVVIVDEFTGRLMPGRRWSDGLHQAVEAKEKGQDRAREPDARHGHLPELLPQVQEALGHDRHGRHRGRRSSPRSTSSTSWSSRPTGRCSASKSRTSSTAPRREKYDAIVNDIIEKQEVGRPVLVGTVSIEKSERLSKLLKLRGIKHVVLNAKYHAQEAEIVAQAGRKGTVTIATNMAGRGTDILLGGNAEFMARQQTLADEIAERLPKGEEKFVDDDEFVYFFHLDSFYRVPRADYERIFGALQDADRRRARRGRRARRPAHHRHRAPRGAPHRQPAARPRRPPGRSRARRASTCRSKTT